MPNLNNTEYNRLDGITKKYVDWKTSGLPNPDDGFQFIDSKDDLPSPIGGVITLEEDKTYYILGNIDLTGDRLVGSNNTCILGASSENSFLTSTGLSSGTPLFTSQYTTPIRHISFTDVDTLLNINGVGVAALDWTGVNLVNIPNIGTISNITNFVFSKGAFLSSKNLVFTGNSGTIAFDNSLFTGNGSSGYIIKVDDNANVTRRFRIVYSSVVAFGSTKGIYFSPTASVPTESYILDVVNFSGGSTYLEGVDVTSNKTLFRNNKGIKNTSVNGQMYMNDNATASVIGTASTWVKVAGNTSPSSDNEKYTHSNNRLTNDAIIERKYLILCNLSFNSGNNNVCKFGFYDSKLGTIRTPSIANATANSSGRAENVSFQCIVNHSSGNYIEIWCQNTSSPTNITVTDMNVTITQII